MYHYRNLPPRHQPPGYYPPHQPSLRQPTTSHHHVPNGSYAGSLSNGLTRSHSHGILNPHSPSITSTAGYRTHHIPPPDKHKTKDPHTTPNGTSYIPSAAAPPDTALYALQQMQRIKAATACQIINNRVVEAIRLQQQQKMQEKQLKRKLDPNWKDPNETNPNNPAYKGPENAKLLKLLSKKKKKIKKVGTKADEDDINDEDTDDSTDEDESVVDEMQDTQYTERTMTVPQLEISTAPKSTANITNLSEEEMKMNPQLYKMYSYYIPFANHHTPIITPCTVSSNSSTTSNHLRSQSLPPHSPPTLHNGARSNIGPRRHSPNFLKENTIGDFRSHSYSPHKPHISLVKAKLVPIGKVKPNPLDIDPPNSVISKSATKRAKDRGKKHSEPHIAPAHANVQSVISPNGGIYHPCHGYSTRDISIFDLFPGIVKYQSKKYAESDRVDYLVSLSEKSFCSVNNRPLKVDEADMWYTALKYLFNDITLGQFDYMSVEMRYVIKQYMSTHKNRLSFLNSIKSYGLLRVISDVSKKLPREHIQKIMRQERQKKEKEQLLSLQKQLRYQQLYHQQQQQHIYQQHLYQQHVTHYADWYNGNKLKRTVSEPTKVNINMNKPCIVDDDEEEEDDIDDSWNFITEIVNNNKIPDLPPEKEKDAAKCMEISGETTHSDSNHNESESKSKSKSREEVDMNMNTMEDNETKEMDEIVDVYTMLYQTMKENDIEAIKEEEENDADDDDDIDNDNDNGPNVSFADLTPINQSIDKAIADDTFTPKVN